MKLDTWTKRREVLSELQKAIAERFPEENYNVFVFGSYVREDFRDGVSDIDLIVYCTDILKRMEIADFCREFFKGINLKADVLEYYYMEDAYIYAVGILNSIQLTDYYPERLRAELYVITRRYSRFLEGQRRKQKYMRWDYAINYAGRGNHHGRSAEGVS